MKLQLATPRPEKRESFAEFVVGEELPPLGGVFSAAAEMSRSWEIDPGRTKEGRCILVLGNSQSIQPLRSLHYHESGVRTGRPRLDPYTKQCANKRSAKVEELNKHLGENMQICPLDNGRGAGKND
jgi:hypothetical protein